ncbi:hypothetical protein [Merismopedia glauca]|uniref:Uncharacterized protein n=1 Tax=Merismopedia glauca CCAP 1448/3 TaxID=1296344 RepID=A0A2T1C365_9CYAN|nr:hypothetical protein [Merismopedia glauca]PSB02715.1 hypothetical protein C7B64_11835 [Merismopedia glauca CCAP 1448/3]
MPLSNEFKAKIKAGNVKEALEMALAEAVELKITTWVAQESKDDASGLEGVDASPSQRLETRINLLSNEIATEIGEQFVDGAIYSQLKVFHQEQVNQSHRLIQNNINCLQRLLNLWGRLDPQIAASLPAVEESALSPNQPLLIDDDERDVIPLSTPIVASSVAETPIISVPEVPSPEINPTEAEDSNSGISIPGVVTVAGVSMLGMSLYANREDSDRTEETESLSELEVRELESQPTTDLESSLLESTDLTPVNEDRPPELVSDWGNADLISSSPEEIPNAFSSLDEQPLAASAFLDPFSDSVPVTSSIESLGEAEIAPPEDESNWEMETYSQSDIPTMESLGEAEIAPPEDESNWEMETQSQSDIPTIIEIPTMESLGESGSEIDLISSENAALSLAGMNSEVSPFEAMDSQADLSEAIAPQESDTWMESDLNLPSATQFFSDEQVSLETQSQADEEIDSFAFSPATNFDNLPIAVEDDVYGVDSIESFDDLATPPVETFAEAGVDELEEVQAIATPVLENPFDLPETPSFQPESWEPETPATPDPVSEAEDLDFNLPGAAVLGGIGFAGLGLIGTQTNAEEEAVAEVPIDNVSPLSPEDNISELPTSISSLDQLVFTESAVTPEAELALDQTPTDATVNPEDVPGLWAPPTLETWDISQEATAPVFDDTQMPDWGLETISQESTGAQAPEISAPEPELDSWNMADLSATEAEMPDWALETISQPSIEAPAPEISAPELELDSWDMADLSANSDLDAASLELGLNNEPELLAGEIIAPTGLTEFDPLENVLDPEKDLNTWEIESSLSSETNLNQDLDDLIGREEIDDNSLDLSTPEVWDNWTEEEEDAVAGLSELSGDTAPVDLASLDLDDENWELPNDTQKWADPFADNSLDGLDDWELVKPEPVQPAITNTTEDLDIFLNSPESAKFPTEPQNLTSPEDLSQWGNDDDPFADIFSMESSDLPKNKNS